MTREQLSASHLHAVILAGGRGTRFWPRSRRRHPKQLMSLWGDESLLRQTADRLRPLIPPRNMWVFTNQALARAVMRQLPEVPRTQIIAEPVQRNTAPCCGLAAELVLARDPDAVLGVFPSDHAVLKPAAFRKIATLAFRHAARGDIVVLGIQPRWPETGYGYMEFSSPPALKPPRALPVKQFREKPDFASAQKYVRAKRFFWNSGMFFWKASVIRDALIRNLPKTAEVLALIAREAQQKKQGTGHLQRLLTKYYPACENISVDYAVLEKAPQVVGIPCDVGWNDLGSWRAVYDLLPQEEHNNVLRTESILVDSSGLYIDVPGKIVGIIGLKDLVVVDTPDALLIAPRDRAHEVSKIVKSLEEAGREDLL